MNFGANLANAYFIFFQADALGGSIACFYQETH